MDSLKIQTNLGEMTVYRLGLRDYAALFKQLKTILPKFTGVVQQADSNEQARSALLEVLPDLIGDSLPDVVSMLELVTHGEWEAEELESLDLLGVVDILVATFEVNDYAEVANHVKKAMARLSQPATPPMI